MKEALNFLIHQEESVLNLTLQNHGSQKVNYSTSCNNCPICQVTFDKIVDEGIFTHLLNYFLFSPLT